MPGHSAAQQCHCSPAATACAQQEHGHCHCWGVTEPPALLRGCHELNAAQRDVGRDLQFQLGLLSLASKSGSCDMLGQRGPPSLLQSSCWGQLGASMGWMVLGMSGVWFHLQPSSEGPHLLFTLLPWPGAHGHGKLSIRSTAPLHGHGQPGDAQHPWECLVATAVSPPLHKQRASVQVPKLLPVGWQNPLP